MSFIHTIGRVWHSGGKTCSRETNHEGSLEKNLNETIAAEQTDFEVVYELDVSAIQAVFITCDQDVTLETNSGSAPDDTLSLKAGVPYVWTTDDYSACLLTSDITSLFVTNAGSEAANLEIYCLVDATPE
jgi:hypothetical protein